MKFQDYYFKLEQKIINFLDEIPERVTYCVLPVLRWETANGEYNSVTVTSSLKITKRISKSFLARRISNAIHDKIHEYHLRDLDIDLFLKGRPWLNFDEFTLTDPEITNILGEQMWKEINLISKYSSQDKKMFLDKAYNLLNYEFKDIIMNNYGDPLFDKYHNLIGYKLNNGDCASLTTYYNENNLLCNKIEIKEFDLNNLTFTGDTLFTWIDVKVENGFIRNYNNKKYYYDKNNILFNVETVKNCVTFPLSKKKYLFKWKSRYFRFWDIWRKLWIRSPSSIRRRLKY